MGAAFRMHQQIGGARVAARIRELNGRCKAGLKEIRGVKLHTPLVPDVLSRLGRSYPQWSVSPRASCTISPP